MITVVFLYLPAIKIFRGVVDFIKKLFVIKKDGLHYTNSKVSPLFLPF